MINKKRHDGADYLRPMTVGDYRKHVIKCALKDLRRRKHRDKFDCIVVSGYSSTIIGSIIADRMNKDILIARKEGEPRNSHRVIDGMVGGKYIFLDDLVCSGATIKRIKDAVHAGDGELYGYWLYRQGKTLSMSCLEGLEPLHSHNYQIEEP